MGIFIGTSIGIGSSSNDVKRIDKSPSILNELPLIYIDGDNVYLSFALNPAFTPVSMTYNYYIDGRFYSDGTLADDGIQWIAEFPEPADYYLELTIVIDSVNTYQFTSNTLTV
jgi:hypothetical protein